MSKEPIDTSKLGPVRIVPPLTARERVRRVANGATINGTYRMFPEAALEQFRKDLLEILEER